MLLPSPLGLLVDNASSSKRLNNIDIIHLDHIVYGDSSNKLQVYLLLSPSFHLQLTIFYASKVVQAMDFELNRFFLL